MREITDRLRELAKVFEGMIAGEVICEAANEIENLRDQLDRAGETMMGEDA
jgi:hypothetical protein